MMIVLLPLLAAACDWDSQARVAAAASVLDSLKARGYTVTEGVQVVTHSTRFGANPGNPYMVYTFGHESLPAFRLEARDAILNIVCTPSNVSYFGWRSYLFAEPFPVFASLGDTLNNLVINTTGGSGDVLSRTAAVVTTGDATAFDHVSAALAGAGLAKATNLEGYAPSAVPHQSLSLFVMLHRASVWSDPVEKAAYFNRTSNIYLLRPPRAQAASPLPLLPLRPRGTGHQEQDVPGLLDALSSLRASVIARFVALGGALKGEESTRAHPLNGRDCIAQRKQCLGEGPLP